MWYEAVWNGHSIRLELTRENSLFSLANYYTTQGALTLLNVLLRCGTRLYKWDTQSNSNSLVKVCSSSWLNITPPDEPSLRIYISVALSLRNFLTFPYNSHSFFMFLSSYYQKYNNIILYNMI